METAEYLLLHGGLKFIGTMQIRLWNESDPGPTNHKGKTTRRVQRKERKLLKVQPCYPTTSIYNGLKFLNEYLFPTPSIIHVRHVASSELEHLAVAVCSAKDHPSFHLNAQCDALQISQESQHSIVYRNTLSVDMEPLATRTCNPNLAICLICR